MTNFEVKFANGRRVIVQADTAGHAVEVAMEHFGMDDYKSRLVRESYKDANLTASGPDLSHLNIKHGFFPDAYGDMYLIYDYIYRLVWGKPTRNCVTESFREALVKCAAGITGEGSEDYEELCAAGIIDFMNNECVTVTS